MPRLMLHRWDKQIQPHQETPQCQVCGCVPVDDSKENTEAAKKAASTDQEGNP